LNVDFIKLINTRKDDKKANLVEAFPDFGKKTHTLKVEDIYFKKLYDTYDELGPEIYKIESDIEPTSDENLNTL
jgi:uncharacterized protein YdcH (DUF465 family)